MPALALTAPQPDPAWAALPLAWLPWEQPAAGPRLILAAGARPDAAWLEVLQELVASHPDAVLLGRAWVREALGDRLDPPELPGWLLLPPAAAWPVGLAPPPATIACDPASLLRWLGDQGEALTLPVLEATDLAPLPRHGQAVAAAAMGWRRHPPQARRLTASLDDAPSLALLLLAPEHQLTALQEQLRPLPSLPWQVVAQPLEPGGAPSEALAAALACSAADWIWPLLPEVGQALPSAALIAALTPWLRRADADGLDLGACGLVLRQRWWANPPPAPPAALTPLASSSWRRSGAHLLTPPMSDPTANGPTSDLNAALLDQLDRAEALLLSQRDRISALERTCANLRQQLNAAAAAPVPPPADPTAD